MPQEMEKMHGLLNVTPSELHPVAETRAYRGVTPDPGAEMMALPGGSTLTMVMAGAGVVGVTGDVPVP